MDDSSKHNGLLKFITCGSVDDGKSTLIGHMLYDAKLIYADQKEALELDSKLGSAGGDIDYSLLLDGLMAEREQGITIDVAYRYFTTERRSFIVADTPGHEEYTRNMAVGASFADLAVILLDATKGVLVQTRRHVRICDLMGIRHFVFAVNKMDLVQFDYHRFSELERDIKKLVAEFSPASVSIIPVSAKCGDNITDKSKNMPWYKGATLLDYLETIDVSAKTEAEAFVMPVQRVCRSDSTFRGFQGSVTSGHLKVGDEITALPNREKAHVKQLLVGDKEVDEVFKGMPLNVQLDREIDISRGSVITKDPSLNVGRLFSAQILWMDDEPLMAGRGYTLKLGTKQVPATVLKIKYKIDVNNGAAMPTDRLFKNEIAVCDISAVSDVVFNTFRKSPTSYVDRALGTFILIDRVSNMTSACGTVSHALRRDENIIPQDLDVTRDIRAGLMNQKPVTIWFTGLSGSGKSTLANALEKRLVGLGKHTMLLDGDNIRLGLNKDLSFKESDRVENIRRIAECAKLMNDAGLIVLTSFISPFAKDRENARKIIGEDFVEVYVSTPLAECEKRDVKGLYKKARNGEIPNFTGISSPYEAPKDPEITVDTSQPIDSCVDQIIEYIREFINSR